MTALAITPLLQQFYAGLVAYIAGVLGLDAEHVVVGLANRVSMPTTGFVLIQAITTRRLRWNLHDFQTLAPTEADIIEGIEVQVQIDCYGPQTTETTDNTGVASDWAQILSATLNDEFGCTALAPSNLQPLYANEARMIPLVDGEEQYEERWSLDAHFQYNPVVTIPQQSANVLKLDLIDVPNQVS